MLSSGGLNVGAGRFCSLAIGGSTGGPDPRCSEAKGAPFSLCVSKVEVPGGSLGLRVTKVEVVEGPLGLCGSMIDVEEFPCCLRGEEVGEFPCLCIEVVGGFPCCLCGEVVGEFRCFLCGSKVVLVGVSLGLKEELRDSKVVVVGASSNELRTASELLLVAGLRLELGTVGAVESDEVYVEAIEEEKGYERVTKHEHCSHSIEV